MGPGWIPKSGKREDGTLRKTIRRVKRERASPVFTTFPHSFSSPRVPGKEDIDGWYGLVVENVDWAPITYKVM